MALTLHKFLASGFSFRENTSMSVACPSGLPADTDPETGTFCPQIQLMTVLHHKGRLFVPLFEPESVKVLESEVPDALQGLTRSTQCSWLCLVHQVSLCNYRRHTTQIILIKWY
jgi:hypothetical protein